MSRGMWSSLILAVVACSALSACGGGDGEVDPIEIASSSAGTGSPISLDIRLDDSGAFEFDQWPSACDLVSKETIKAIFPQTEGVQQDGTDSQIRVLSLGLASSPDNGPKTIHDSSCATRVGFTQEGLGLADDVTVVVVNSQILAAGNPKFVKRNFHESAASKDVKIGETTCGLADSNRTYECNVGRVAFKLTVDMRQYAQYIRGLGSDYLIDGKTVTFRGTDPDFDAVVTDKVLTPLASAAVSRLG